LDHREIESSCDVDDDGSRPMRAARVGRRGAAARPGLVEEIAARGYWEQVWRRFKRDRVALASIGFLILLVLLGEGLRDAFDPRSRL
jgi:N-terminal TM domain of oligopeptide transport permease C